MACVQFRIDEKLEATALAQKVRRVVRFDCHAIFCDDCDAFHVKYDGNKIRIDQLHQRVLEMVAQGLRDAEIADQLAITQTKVSRCVDRLSRRLNALSRANLIAISAVLGIINPTTFVASVKVIERTA